MPGSAEEHPCPAPTAVTGLAQVRLTVTDLARSRAIGAGAVLEFRDPDGIALELYAPPA